MSQKKLRTVINWRPYPVQKPPKDAWIYPVMHKSGVFSVECWTGKHWESINSRSILKTVTHFALPSDISTMEVEG